MKPVYQTVADSQVTLTVDLVGVQCAYCVFVDGAPTPAVAMVETIEDTVESLCLPHLNRWAKPIDVPPPPLTATVREHNRAHLMEGPA